MEYDRFRFQILIDMNSENSSNIGYKCTTTARIRATNIQGLDRWVSFDKPWSGEEDSTGSGTCPGENVGKKF